MRQTPGSQAQRQRNGNYTAFRTSGSLISSTVASICCCCVLIGAISGLTYSNSHFGPWVTTTATIVGVERMGLDNDSNQINYCPQIQFSTGGEATNRNITTVLETSCADNPGNVVLGDSVAIRYDPSEPTEAVDAVVPDVIEVAMICVITLSALCSCCYVAIGIVAYKASISSASNGEHQTSYTYENNHTHSSIPMTNVGGNSTQYSESRGYSNNDTYTTSSEPVETTASAVFVAPNEEQPGADPSGVPAFPEGTTANTGIAAGEEAPPMVGCTLISSNNNAASLVSQEQTYRPSSASQTYVSPSSLPLNPVAPNSSYISPSDIREAMATIDRPGQYR